MSWDRARDEIPENAYCQVLLKGGVTVTGYMRKTNVQIWSQKNAHEDGRMYT